MHRKTSICSPKIFLDSKTVTATASSKEKLDMLLSLPDNTNATHVANYKSQDFAEEVLKTTNGKGVDIIVDFVGSSHWVQNIKSLARDGRMTMLSFLSGTNHSVITSLKKGAC